LFTGPARQVARNTRIFRAGEPAISLFFWFFLASGLVKLTDLSTSGDGATVARASRLEEEGDFNDP
jgi:hypothetical protein